MSNSDVGRFVVVIASGFSRVVWAFVRIFQNIGALAAMGVFSRRGRLGQLNALIAETIVNRFTAGGGGGDGNYRRTN